MYKEETNAYAKYGNVERYLILALSARPEGSFLAVKS
jgi:hypothetical protein